MRPTRLRGARTNNLRAIDLDLEPGTLVAIVGPSGAGKSSLAFGTLYAEGQRRYVESFSAYARQFLERLARPDVDELDPVPAGIAVDRQAPVKTSRSTVGTMTELTDYSKTLYARAAELHCAQCGRRVERDAPTDAAAHVLRDAPGAKLLVTYPVAVSGAEQFLGVREALLADGYRRVRIGGEVRDLDAVRPSDVLGEPVHTTSVTGAKKARKASAAKTAKAKSAKSAKSASAAPLVIVSLEVIADRTVARESDRARLVEALESAMRRGNGRADIVAEDGRTFRFSRTLHCAHCDLSYKDATPGTFSFNSPIGACEPCRGFGRTIGIDWERVLPDERLSLLRGAIKAWSGKSAEWERKELAKHAKLANVPMDVPLGELTPAQRTWLIEGDGRGWSKGWVGLRGWFQWMETKAYKMHVRVFLSRYRKYEECVVCKGTRLKPEAQLWKIGGLSITGLYALTVAQALVFFAEHGARLSSDPATALVVREILARLQTLADVGLVYLGLDRASRTLSGGEAQRVALASALGASLTGAMFVLDEPTVGLHPSDTERLFSVVRKLTSGSNLAIIVEHDPSFIAGADRVIELGPGAGEHGGTIVFDGTPAALAKRDTATARALAPMRVERSERRSGKGALVLRGASGNNLIGDTLTIPRGVITVVTGPSGSGKSSLVLETLVPAVQKALGETPKASADGPLPFTSLTGFEGLASVVHVDQSPLGRTSRGNPATYLEVWDTLRKRFASAPLSKQRGYSAGFFSFNVPGGRCEACRGEGAETVEMQFLADVHFSCPECGGKRFVGPVLDVTIATDSGGTKNVAQALDMTASEAVAAFGGDKELQTRIKPLVDVGLGYLRLGQPLSTLSGGEAQRLKLAESLGRTKAGSLVVLDEPTAGLHHQDVGPLLAVLERLVARGDTVIVVEHDMRVAAWADHVIDLGPGAGREGGRIVAEGTPEAVADVSAAPSGRYIAEALGRSVPNGTRAARAARITRPADAKRDATIHVEGAREHNLRDVTIEIPRDQLVVVTGPSGSGKSTLAFDVIHAEAQRRYLETLSPYARQFLPQLPRPNVDRVTGLPPSVSLEQRVTRGGGNSTVATVTEIAHYLRLLYARAGLLHCPDCGVPIAPRQPSALAADVRKQHRSSAEVLVLAPVVRARKGHHGPVFARAAKEKITEARVDGTIVAVTRTLKLARFKEHDVDFVVARMKLGDVGFEDALRRALTLADGAARLVVDGKESMLSSKRACPQCGKGFPELDPRFFSFNTKQGQCATCEGHGVLVETIGRGKTLREVESPCTDCHGSRLSPLVRAVTIGGAPITSVLELSVSDARVAVAKLGPQLEGRAHEVGEAPLHELAARLAFLEQVGLGYMALDRAANTLSGGETQRVRLAAQLGSGLTGILYVLDEPTIGLHPRDTAKLLSALRALVEKGCSVLVVEHDSDTIRAADYLVDVGPSGGTGGGRIVAEGPARTVLADPDSVTGASLARGAQIPAKRRSVAKDTPRLVVRGVTEHNLRGVDLSVPLGRLVAVTGVSGSGKSTLTRDVLLRATRKALDLESAAPGAFRAIEGVQHLKRAIEVDQSPIGRTPRSVPATYVGVWDELRRLLAATPEARAAGYTASRFSFNVAEGRCPACGGNGALTVEMSFMPEVLVPCDTCRGARFTEETLRAKLHGLDASQLLQLDIAEAAEKLHAFPKVAAPLRTLTELGLGYLKLGQPSNTLSGGEAQRLKLVAELGTAAGGPTLYVMDEPTTGLHREDVRRLLALLDRLVERGDTVVVIEHHPDVIVAADWVVDLGPEGGAGGGQLVAEGTPEDVARVEASHTGAVIRAELGLTARASTKGAKKRASTSGTAPAAAG